LNHHYSSIQPSKQNRKHQHQPPQPRNNNAQTSVRTHPQILFLGFLLSLESHYSNLIFVTLSSTSCACTFSATPIHYHTPPPFPANRHRHCSGPLVSDWPVLDELHKERQQHSKVVRLRAAWSSGLCLPAPYTACDTGTAASKQEVSSGGTSLLLLAYHLHVYAVAEKVRLARSRSHHSSIAFWNSHTTVVSCT
jgi:hypothetical protein